MYYLAGTIWVGVIAYLLVTWLKRPEKVREIFRHFLKSGKIFVGIVPMALLAAGFLTPLVPGEFVARWLGDSAGMTAIIVGTLAGWCLPVPPIIFYPIVAVLLKTGAGMPALTALICAWSVFGIHRTMLMELPLMGRYFVTLRVMCSIAFPPIAGLIAILISGYLGVS
jgi:uncharacterized membrane protein YraQ (UPF0718 family)